MFNLADYVALTEVINDRNVAEEKHLTVKKVYQRTPRLQKLEDELRAVPSDDPDWRDKVMGLKKQVAEEKANLARYIIKYQKHYLNADNIQTLGLFRSVITNGKKILAFSAPKSVSYDLFNNETVEGDREFLEFCEGTMINMYHDTYTDEWEIATRSNIGARCKFFQESNSTFRTMFLEALNKQNIEFNEFNKEYSYSFVLQHPENRIVVPFMEPKIILTNIYKCLTDTVEEVSLNEFSALAPMTKLTVPAKLTESESFKTISLNEIKNALYSLETKVDYTLQGVIVYDRALGLRYKIRNPRYEYVRHLKGNNPKLQYQYYCLRQGGKVTEYLQYFPEHADKLRNFRSQLHNWTFNLHRNYVACYVQKQKPLRDFPFEYRSHMYKLHELYRDQYRETRGAITRRVVVEYVNTLPPNHIMASVNYPLRHADARAKRESIVAQAV